LTISLLCPLNMNNTMETIIKYENSVGEPITEQQAAILSSYSKEFWIDGVLKKSEYYSKNVLLWLSYYLDENEDSNTILAQYSDINVALYSVKNYQGNYYSRNTISYQKGVLYTEGIEVFDNQDRIIMTRSLYPSGLLHDNTKWFYTDNHDTIPSHKPLLNFTYSSDGSVDHRPYDYEGDQNENLNLIKESARIRQYFKWEEHPYYHDGNSVFP